MKQVYLAGAIDGVDPAEASTWRNAAKTRFRNANCDVFDPMAAFTVGGHGEGVQPINWEAIRRSDVVMAELYLACDHIGTLMEVGFALALEIPVVCWTDGKYKRHLAMQAVEEVDNLFGAVDRCIGVPAAGPQKWLLMPEKGAETVLGDGLSRAFPGDAGVDIPTLTTITIPPRSFVDVPLAYRLAPPPGWWYRLEGRSSTFRRLGLLVTPGVIDNGYRGPLFAAVYNMGDEPREVVAGSKLVQILPFRVHWDGVDFEHVDELPSTQRGEAGFGSTGR